MLICLCFTVTYVIQGPGTDSKGIPTIRDATFRYRQFEIPAISDAIIRDRDISILNLISYRKSENSIHLPLE